MKGYLEDANNEIENSSDILKLSEIPNPALKRWIT